MPFLDGKYDRETLATMHRALEGAWREVERADRRQHGVFC